MERVQGPQTPFESYCFQCRVTFPVEQKRCVHCGSPLARAGQRIELGSASTLPDARPLPGDAEDELLGEGASPTLRRFGGLLIWALVAASALLSNLCQRG